MASLSAFQKQKLDYLFRQFYDSNKNGVITHSDFVDLLRDLQKMRNWSPGDSRLKAAGGALENAWNGLKRGADTNKDQKVTLEEWHGYWTDFLCKSKNSPDGWPQDVAWMKEYMHFWFNLMDTSDDGLVDENEFAQICTHFGIAEVEARAAFKKFGLKPVDSVYFSELWLQYMTSDDSATPGTFVFGRTSFK